MMRLARKRFLLLGGLSVAALVCVYYYSILGPSAPQVGAPEPVSQGEDSATTSTSTVQRGGVNHETCAEVSSYPADLDTVEVFQQLEMLPDWMERREYWSSDMEDRFQRRRPMWPRLPLRVIVMPHSHTDPGWLKTIEGYFATATKNIMNNMVNKLTEHKNMTFIWTEMSYLSMWWDGAQPDMRKKLRQLLDSGRLEVPTGGWVMTDEANVDLFSMIDQLVEGHTFLRDVLGVIPESSWSVDSFGHGGTFPHLLAKSGIDNMVIMRIHYAWKEYLARHQQGEFLWKQPWEVDGSEAPLCHNFPYDIYSIKHSCGPHPSTCLGFDFRHVEGEFNEFSMAYTPIDAANLKTRSELLLEQYGRTGSLLPHNVVLVPLGDDFRYNTPTEFDQQYHNYMQIMQFINSNDYNAEITFGTLTDYFREVRARQTEFKTLSGDFFVYSDIFSEGQPAYWSGYYSTRPHLKLLSRQLASGLRATEILFTMAVAQARARGAGLPLAVLGSQYDQLTEARRHLGLFQHHDAITGTSKAFVMQDYEQKLAAGLETVRRMTEVSAQYLLQTDQDGLDLSRPLRHVAWRGGGPAGGEFLSTLDLHAATAHSLVIYNSLAEAREELIMVRTNSASVCVRDEAGDLLDAQTAPHFNTSGQARLDFGIFDVWFRAALPPLSLSTFIVTFCDRTGSEFASSQSKVFCMVRKR
jgi:alpha-mannosidase